MASGIRRGVCSLVIAAWVVSGVTTPAIAAPGDLDPDFGAGGTVLTTFPVGSFSNAVAIQPDGFALARYLAV